MQSTALVEAGSATSLTTITKETIVDPLDSLPYVDTELNDEETRARVQAMIQHGTLSLYTIIPPFCADLIPLTT